MATPVARTLRRPVDVSLWAWIALLAGVIAMLAVDLLMHRDAHVITVREAALWSGVWVAVGLFVGGIIWWVSGSEFGLQYLAGYVIEKSLAIDNVFVWAIIFGFFAVPRQYQHRVLFYGVVGALVFRAVFIALGSVVIASAAWVLYLFGAFLIVTGIRMMRQRNEHFDVSKSRALSLFRRYVPSTDEYDGAKFLTRRNGVLVATPLLVVLVLIEFTDIIFAVDSIPAVFAVTQEPFLVFASNALAILGLRAMYFLLADLIHRFVYLKLGLSLVLVWVGVKMIVSHGFFPIPTVVSLGVVLAILATSIVASLVVSREKANV
jgi:tellurite resistance protein TerC